MEHEPGNKIISVKKQKVNNINILEWGLLLSMTWIFIWIFIPYTGVDKSFFLSTKFATILFFVSSGYIVIYGAYGFVKIIYEITNSNIFVIGSIIIGIPFFVFGIWVPWLLQFTILYKVSSLLIGFVFSIIIGSPYLVRDINKKNSFLGQDPYRSGIQLIQIELISVIIVAICFWFLSMQINQHLSRKSYYLYGSGNCEFFDVIKPEEILEEIVDPNPIVKNSRFWGSMCPLQYGLTWFRAPRVKPGQVITIEYIEGLWTANKDDLLNFPYTDVLGYPDQFTPGNCNDDLSLKDSPLGALIYKIGKGGEAHPVNKKIEFTANNTGFLYLGMNDSENCNKDNSGVIHVVITIDG